MEALRILEEKISSLIKVIHELKTKNDTLKNENSKSKAENKELKAENALLVEEKTQLSAKLNMMESSLLKDNERIEETKIVVDDLIKSIDALVKNEHQK